MKSAAPVSYLWWMISRASGVLAIVLISLSVALGLSMAARVLRRPTMKRTVVKLHEHLALISLVAIAVHGLALLGDRWLRPGITGIAVPFVTSYRPQFTGIGIVAGYVAVLVGPSFYIRRHFGSGRWRKLHRASVLVWIMAAVHTLGAGSDSSKLWLRAIVLLPAVPLVYLLVVRSTSSRPVRLAPAPATAGRARALINASVAPGVATPQSGIMSGDGAGHDHGRDGADRQRGDARVA